MSDVVVGNVLLKGIFVLYGYVLDQPREVKVFGRSEIVENWLQGLANVLGSLDVVQAFADKVLA